MENGKTILSWNERLEANAGDKAVNPDKLQPDRYGDRSLTVERAGIHSKGSPAYNLSAMRDEESHADSNEWHLVANHPRRDQMIAIRWHRDSGFLLARDREQGFWEVVGPADRTVPEHLMGRFTSWGSFAQHYERTTPKTTETA